MRRPERVAEQVRAEITQIVGYELDDPRLLPVSVSGVQMSEDLRDASIYVSFDQSIGESEIIAAIKALRRAEPYVRRQLGFALSMRYVPRLHFVRDQVEERAARLEKLLAQELRSQEPSNKLHPEVENGVESQSSDQTGL
ncbi:MAG: 30S ribosome-binding factor RbfA [Pyrinomonadaceae bacterium]